MTICHRWVLASALLLPAGCGGSGPPVPGGAENELNPSDKLQRDLDANNARTKAANPSPAKH